MGCTLMKTTGAEHRTLPLGEASSVGSLVQRSRYEVEARCQE